MEGFYRNLFFGPKTRSRFPQPHRAIADPGRFRHACVKAEALLRQALTRAGVEGTVIG